MGNSIFNQYIEKRNVITKNKKVLPTTYVPNVLPHRVEQIDSIASIISIALNGEKSNFCCKKCCKIELKSKLLIYRSFENIL